MALHNCPHSFRDLAKTVLPGHMRIMHAALQATEPMSDFAREGVAVQRLLAERKLAKDFSGCYVLVDGVERIYVGISRGVLGRLRQHVFGKTHFDASLAFRIAFKRHPNRAIEKLTREQSMADPLFGTSFTEAQAYLRSLRVAYIQIPNALELYIFEAYCAMELDTHQWNSFETH